jgi:hypothetical protein
MAGAIVFIFPASALENERYPGVPDAVNINPASAIDPQYLQFEMGIGHGTFTSKILHSADDWEKESEAAVNFMNEGYPTADGIAAATNSQAIRKYRDGPSTSGEKDKALSRCYLRSANIWSTGKNNPDSLQFAEDMYDRALEYNRFNFDAWDGKIKLLESQGLTSVAQDVRDQKNDAMNDQARLAYNTHWFLPLPGYMIIIAVFGAILLMATTRKKIKK